MSKRPDIIDLIIRDNTAILSEQLVSWLEAKPGDKISIGYIEQDEKLTPIVTIDDSGHKLNKNNSISFRGKQREVLGQLGTNFWATKTDDGMITLEGDGMPVFTTVKKAVQTYLTRDIIEDTNYSITKLTNYEF